VPDLWRFLWGNSKTEHPLLCKQLMGMVSAEGLEPSTHALKGHCSTN
jgi:hypothetical protein